MTSSKREGTGGMAIERALRNISNAERFAFDIGSRVIRIVYTSRVHKHPCAVKEEGSDSIESTRLHCIHFPHSDLPDVCRFIAANIKIGGRTIPFASTRNDMAETQNTISTMLDVKLVRISDMDCLVKGTNFLLQNIIDEVFVYDHHNSKCRYRFHTMVDNPRASLYPFVLVNIGTGMSINLVESSSKFTYIGGSHLGGGAFFGLARLLTGVNDIEELLRMAEDGDHRKVDTLVSDIYGHDYSIELLGLPPDLIAGSFAKCSKKEVADEVSTNPEYKKDLVRSLLLMISNEIGQVTSLMASHVQTPHIFFNGFMVRNHPIIMRTISYAVGYWSKGAMQAHFLRHEAYTAAIGALVNGKKKLPDGEDYRSVECVSWREHYEGCSDLGRFVPKQPLDLGFRAETLELDCTDMLLKPFTLLSPTVEYVPDTVDLNMDLPARKFWIEIMESSAEKMVQRAIESQPDDPTASERGKVAGAKFLEQLRLVREKPFAYGTCNVRNLLDLREQIFTEYNFDDPYKKAMSYFHQKEMENDVALLELPNVLAKLDGCSDAAESLKMASAGLLAGNVFDWGAKEVVKLLERSEQFTFDNAISVIPDRPWLIDTLDAFVTNTLEGRHKSAAIFVDNSGADVVLGVLPFARELLKLSTKVIIISNLLPALNDITFNELADVMERTCKIDSVIGEAMREGRLKISHHGQGSPCLDLRRVDSALCDLVLAESVDLVVIEGMGRALHTNFNAKFTVSSLKAAVIKTQWLADRMGGDIFSVVFKYEAAE